jgi:hypothetical protein
VSDSDVAVVVLNNGEWFVYDPVEDTWARNLDAPFASTLGANYGYQLCQGAKTKGFFKNGKEVWEYNPNTNQWLQLPDFPFNSAGAYTFGIDDELYIGLDQENELWVYKEHTDKWTQKATSGILRQMGLYFSVANKGYLGMGLKLPEEYFIYDFHEYNP